MAFLKTRLIATWSIGLILIGSAQAGSLPFLSGIEATNEDSAGSGQSYSGGGNLQLRFGDSEDLASRTGDIHGGYTAQLSPRDPSVENSSLKNSNSWSGGFSVDIWKGAFFGMDLDSIRDATENLEIDGFKFLLGYEPIRFSYRHGRSVIRDKFTTAPLPPAKSQTLGGAFIYQDTFELEGSLELTKRDILTATGDYSKFSPDAVAFANTLNRPALGGLSSFSDTLQSFEKWSLGLSWKHEMSDRWNFSTQFRVAQMIVADDHSQRGTLSINHRLSERWSGDISAEYQHESPTHQWTFTLAVHYTWDRGDPL